MNQDYWRRRRAAEERRNRAHNEARRKREEERRRHLSELRKKRKKHLKTLNEEDVLRKYGGEGKRFKWNDAARGKLFTFVASAYGSHCRQKRIAKKLRIHLENQFENGMNWANYVLEEWEIDHIIPKKYMDPDTGLLYWSQTDKSSNDLDNLQPMWTWQNISKSNKYVGKYRERPKSPKKQYKVTLPPFLYTDSQTSLEAVQKIRKILSSYEYKLFSYIRKGYSQIEIAVMMNKGKTTISRDSMILKQKVNELVNSDFKSEKGKLENGYYIITEEEDKNAFNYFQKLIKTEKNPIPRYLYINSLTSKEIIFKLKRILTGYEYTLFTYIRNGCSQAKVAKQLNKGQSVINRDWFKTRIKINQFLMQETDEERLSSMKNGKDWSRLFKEGRYWEALSNDKE